MILKRYQFIKDTTELETVETIKKGEILRPAGDDWILGYTGEQKRFTQDQINDLLDKNLIELIIENPEAFPTASINDAGDGVYQAGIDLRDYFAAHAPEVPDWFKPDIPEKPKHPGYMHNTFGKGSGHPHADVFIQRWDEEEEDWYSVEFIRNIGQQQAKKIPESLKIEVANHLNNIREWRKADEIWNINKRWETVSQWRYKYADFMLAKRMED